MLNSSYNRLGKNADEKDADEIIEMGSKASVSDQQRQVQENVHFQIKNISQTMDSILRPDTDRNTPNSVPDSQNGSRRSGLSFAIGSSASANKPGNGIPIMKSK